MKGQSPPPLQKTRAPVGIKRPDAGQRQSRMRRSQPSRPRTSLCPPPIKSYLDDPDCNSLRESILSSSEPYDFSQLETDRLTAFISHLREYEAKLAREENYPEASIIRELGNEAREVLLGRASEGAGGASEIQAREASMQSRQAQSKVESEKAWQEKIEKYKQETEEKRGKLEELHAQQLERFEKKWQEEKPSEYRKPSAKLLQLKYMEKNIAKRRDYSEAEVIHAEAERLIRQESESAQKALVLDYKNAKERLLKRQETELQQFEYARGEGLKMLENQFKEAKDKAERRDQVITFQKASVNTRAMKLAAMSASQPTPVKKRDLKSELLPPLIPPNDPKFVEEEERKARAENKRRLDLQRKKEEEASSRWGSTRPSPCPSKMPSDDESPPSKSKTTKPTPKKKPLGTTPKKAFTMKPLNNFKQSPVKEEPPRDVPAEEPAPAPVPYTQTVAPEEEPAQAPAEDLPSPDPVYLYAYGITPSEETAAPAAEETEPVQAVSEPEQEVPAEPAPVYEEAPAPEPVAEEVAEPAPAEETPAEEPAAAPKKKPKSTLILQSAADDSNVWGTAVIKPAKKKAEKKPAEQVSEETAVPEGKETAEKKPAKKAQTKKPAAADVASDSEKEETKVAKEKAASDTKKDTKAAAKPAEKKPAAKKETAKATPAKAQEKKPAAKAAPAKKETAKAQEKKPAAKAAAKPVKEETKPAKAAVKEDTKPAEQVIEAGDESDSHGKFVIKKTDKGNFVYKLYSSNYRVVAIGAGLYTSITNCKTGINSVRNNADTAPIEDQTLQKWEELKFPKWQIYTDKQGEIRLRLLASNGNIVATTNDGYLSKEAAKKGIAAIARAAKGAAIVRNDDLW